MLLDRIIKLPPIKIDNNVVKIDKITNQDTKDIKNIKINQEFEKKLKYTYDDLKFIEKIEIDEDKITKCINLMREYKHLPGEKIFIVDVKKINDLWKRHENYLGDNYDEIKMKKIYLLSRLDLIDGKINIPPLIWYDDLDDLIQIIDGRHRFSNLRDLGCREIPVVVIDKITLDKVEKDLKYYWN